MKAVTVIVGSGFARGVVMLSELVLLLVTSSYMAPATRGIYVVGYAFLKTTAVLSTLSVNQAALRLLALQRSKRDLSLISGSLLVGGIGFSLVAGLVLSCAGAMSEVFRVRYLVPFWPLLVALPIFVLEVLGYSLLLGTGRLRQANFAMVIGKIGTVLATGVLALSPAWLTVHTTWAAIVGGQAVILALYFRAIRAAHRDTGGEFRFEASHLLGLARSGLKIHASVVGTIIFGSLDVILVYQNVGPAQASIYQIALQLISVLAILPHATSQYGGALVTNEHEQIAWQRYKRALWIVFLLYTMLSLSSWPIVIVGSVLLSGDKYANLQTIYPLMLLGLPGMYLAQVMAPIWVRRGYFKTLSALTLASGAILLPLTYYLTLKHGLNGAVAAFLTGQCLGLITNGLFVIHVNKTTHAIHRAQS